MAGYYSGPIIIDAVNGNNQYASGCGPESANSFILQPDDVSRTSAFATAQFSSSSLSNISVGDVIYRQSVSSHHRVEDVDTVDGKISWSPAFSTDVVSNEKIYIGGAKRSFEGTGNPRDLLKAWQAGAEGFPKANADDYIIIRDGYRENGLPIQINSRLIIRGFGKIVGEPLDDTYGSYVRIDTNFTDDVWLEYYVRGFNTRTIENLSINSSFDRRTARQDGSSDRVDEPLHMLDINTVNPIYVRNCEFGRYFGRCDSPVARSAKTTVYIGCSFYGKDVAENASYDLPASPASMCYNGLERTDGSIGYDTEDSPDVFLGCSFFGEGPSTNPVNFGALSYGLDLIGCLFSGLYQPINTGGQIITTVNCAFNNCTQALGTATQGKAGYISMGSIFVDVTTVCGNGADKYSIFSAAQYNSTGIDSSHSSEFFEFDESPFRDANAGDFRLTLAAEKQIMNEGPIGFSGNSDLKMRPLRSYVTELGLGGGGSTGMNGGMDG